MLVRDGLRHGDDVLEVLNLWEIDETGRLARATLFDPDDLAGAIAALDDRHAAIRSTPVGAYERWFADRPLATVDWDRAAAEWAAPDCVAIDHRVLGFPEADLDEYLAAAGR